MHAGLSRLLMFFCILNLSFFVGKLKAGSHLVSKGVSSTLQEKMSSFVLERRLTRLPVKKRYDKFAEMWASQLKFSKLLAVVPSSKLTTFESFCLAINYTALTNNRDQPYGTHFDIFFKKDPDMFLLEGVHTVGGIEFEDELCIKDISGGQTFEFQVIKNDCFPKKLIERMLKGEEVEKSRLSSELRILQELIVCQEKLVDETVYSYNWMPILSPLQKDPQITIDKPSNKEDKHE